MSCSSLLLRVFQEQAKAINIYWRTGEENGERAEISGKVERSEENPFLQEIAVFLIMS